METAVARIEQLQQLVGAAAGPGGNGGNDFASQLTAATASPRAEPVDLLVNGKPIARGEVVVIDQEFGLLITDVVTAPGPVADPGA